MKKWLIRAMMVLLGLVAVPFLLFPAGAALPHVKILGPVGTFAILYIGPWLLLITAALAAIAWWRWKFARSMAVLLLALLLSAAATGDLVLVGTILAAARASGLHVDLAQTLFLTRDKIQTAPEADAVYATLRGEPMGMAIIPASGAGQGPTPVLVYVHGGGWTSGDYRGRLDELRWFAAHGMTAVAMQYPLSSATRHLWDSTQADIGCGLAWVGTNIARYGGDPSRIALLGESAGGNLVLNAGYMANAAQLGSSCGGAVPRVAAVVAIYPATDAVDLYHNRDTLKSVGIEALNAYVGGPPEQFPDRYRTITSFTYIHPGAPATLLLLPDDDAIVPPQRTREFAAQARNAGVSVRLVEAPFANHGFDLVPGSIGNQIMRQATIGFLKAQGLIR